MTPIIRARWIIVILGALLPYLARIPGSFIHGAEWLMSYVEVGFSGMLFFAALNAIAWGTVLLATKSMKHARSTLFPATLGFIIPALGHLSLDLAADAQAAIVLVIIPFFAIPGALIGGVIGRRYDRRLEKRT